MTHLNVIRLRTAASLILSLGLLLSGAGQHAARAQSLTPAPSCTIALDSLMAEWQSIGFAEPSKPGQMVVTGQHGNTTTGGQFNYMRRQISAGARDCAAGRDADALSHFNTVHGILAHTHI
jgi:hypothetical protein